MANDRMGEIPYGTRDFLPLEAAEKRAVETSLTSLFTSWGYDGIETPVMEFLSTLTVGNGQRIEPRMFKFFDRDNRTIALRHEMTTPIARVVASRMKDVPRPLKISYVGRVYRYEETQRGRRCEFTQAGVEFMGSDAPAADAEVLALAVESLRQTGLRAFRISLGQAAFIHGLMRGFALTEEEERRAKNFLEKRDLVGWRTFLDGTALPPGEKKILEKLPLLHGGREILDEARDMAVNEESVRAIDNLATIYRLLESYQAAEAVQFDLGVIRDLDYYTGMVFEAYMPGLGFPLCGGGRYDRLLADFGADCPATGFALGVERLLLAVEQAWLSRSALKKEVYVAYAPGCEAAAIRAAQEERRAGRVTELSPMPQEEQAAKESQKSKGYAALRYLK
ncbi:MAG: ATP phosphoribosyltransferase regulatory subunit [Schwartzia sp. (in: firmicutes)]